MDLPIDFALWYKEIQIFSYVKNSAVTRELSLSNQSFHYGKSYAALAANYGIPSRRGNDSFPS